MFLLLLTLVWLTFVNVIISEKFSQFAQYLYVDVSICFADRKKNFIQVSLSYSQLYYSHSCLCCTVSTCSLAAFFVRMCNFPCVYGNTVDCLDLVQCVATVIPCEH